MRIVCGRAITSIVCAGTIWGLFGQAAGAGEIKMARHPDYHQGKITFSYLGDIWRAQEDGSNPRRLTVHRAFDAHPRFSPDGKWIAFSSNRYGDYDVFVIPSEGGAARRLTYHSAPDTVVGWSRDSKRVMFSSSRGRVFPGIPSLYEVAVEGSLEEALPTDWGIFASYSPDGSKLAFNRHPLPWFRKHYRGSYSADLWIMDLHSHSAHRLVDNDLPDDQRPNNFWPMYRSGEIYFVSDRGVMGKAGSPELLKSVNNIWKVAEIGGPPIQVTHHASGSLFWPSLSSDGKTIVYEENFGIWKLDLASGKTSEIKLDIAADDRENNNEAVVTSNEAEAFNLSPSARRAVITVQGDLFTIATDRGDVRRLTSTPGVRERNPVWSLDGKWIAYIGDATGEEQIYLIDEKGSKPKQITNSSSLKGQVVWSPNSKALLFTDSSKRLFKYDVAQGETKVLAQGEVISFGGNAINTPAWSPDSKWVSYTKEGANLMPHVYIVAAEGGPERRLTDADSVSDGQANWAGDGKHIVYVGGMDIANIGQAGRGSEQIYAAALTKEEKDPSDRSIDSEEQAQAAGRPPAGRRTDGAAGEARPEVKLDLEHIARRTRQLTRSGDNVGGLSVSPDGRTVVFATRGTEGGAPVQSLWSVGIDGDRLTRIVEGTRPAATADAPPPTRGGPGLGGFAQLQFARDGRTLYYRQGAGIYAVAITPGAGGDTPAPAAVGGGRGGRGGLATAAAPPAVGGATPRRLTFTVRHETDQRALNHQVFNESWRVMKYRFYDANMHGVDWLHMKSVYGPLVSYVSEREEMQDIVNMMIGELNASHTGLSGGTTPGETIVRTSTRHPGFELVGDRTGYYKIDFIYKSGPADKDWIKLKPGDFVLAIDGQDIKAGDNYWKYYTLAPSTKIDFTVNSKPTKEGAWHVKLTPAAATAVANWQYDKWVNDRRAQVDKLSGGRVGYLHIRQMNEPSLRKFERDLGMYRDKEAMIVDQRFNPGGGIDQELLEILGQRQYQYTRVRDSVEVKRPLRGFFGPMVVMENERSTSDAEVFPDGFRTLKLGKVVGVTTYGAVIGTGAHQMMDGSSIRTPSSGLWNVNGTNLENYGVPPDVYVDNTPQDFVEGKDAQLKKAVEVLLDDLKKLKK
jgi:tricorn protease